MYRLFNYFLEKPADKKASETPANDNLSEDDFIKIDPENSIPDTPQATNETENIDEDFFTLTLDETTSNATGSPDTIDEGFHLIADLSIDDFNFFELPSNTTLPENNDQMPRKNKPVTFYSNTLFSTKTNTDKSAHEISLVRKQVLTHDERTDQKKIEYKSTHYFQKIIDANKWLMAPLEAASNAFYRFLTPHVVTSSRAVYDETGRYVSVVSKAIKEFNSFRQVALTQADLQDPVKVTKIAEMLVSSYLFKEDDLHRGNIGLNGRLDFDMSFYPILRWIKGSRNWINDQSRAFKFTAADIQNFPDIIDNNCYYWPTKLIWWADNSFSQEQIDIFKQLKDNPVFIYAKFKTMLKFLLTMDVKICRQIAALHLPLNATIKMGGIEKNAIELFVEEIQKSKKELRDTLLSMPEFQAFMEKDGEKAMAEISADMKTHNDKIKIKVNKGKDYYQPLFFDINSLADDYSSLYTKNQEQFLMPFDINEKGEPAVTFS